MDNPRWSERMPQGWHRKVSPRAVQLMHEIGALMDASGGAAIAPIEQLAADLHCGRRAVERALAELDRFIARQQPYPGGPNQYVIREPKPTRKITPQTETPPMPQQTPPAGEGPIIHVTSKSTQLASTTTYDASPSHSPSYRVSPSGSHLHRANHHHPADVTHPATAPTPTRGGGGGNGGGDEERKKLAAELVAAGISAEQAPRLILKHGAETCARNLALWRTQRNVGPGKLVRMIEADAAALTKQARGMKAKAQQERRAVPPSVAALESTAPVTVGTAVIEKQQEKGAAMVAEMTDAALSTLADEIIAATGNKLRRSTLIKRRPEIRTDPAWLCAIAVHGQPTPTH